MFITQTLAASSDIPAWSRDDPGAAAARRDGAGAHRDVHRRPPARAATRVRLCPAWRDPESVDAYVGRRPASSCRRFCNHSSRFATSLTVVSNLARPEKLLQDHACTGSWLTGVPPKRTEGSDFLAAQEHRPDHRRQDRTRHDLPVARGRDRGFRHPHRCVHEPGTAAPT